VELQDKIMNPDQEEAFARLVETIYNRHSKVLVQMARGAYEFRDAIRMGQFPELANDNAAIGFSNGINA